MRVLVTGGAGFIGSRVAARYLADGHEVIVLDDLSSGDASAVPDGAKLSLADVADPATVQLVAGLGPQLVVHAAAQVSVARSVTDPARDGAVNVDGTRHVVDGAREAGARRLVFLSSGGAVYGETDGATEDTPPDPKSPYGEHKLLAEQLVAAAPVSYAIARLSNVYGPGQRDDLEGGVVAIFSNALLEGRPVTIHGDGLQRRDLVHVDDVVEAVVLMGESDVPGVWNVGAGRSHTILDLLAMLEARLGPAVSCEEAPARAGDVRVSQLVVDRIRRDLGWRPRLHLDAGLDRLVQARAGAVAAPG